VNVAMVADRALRVVTDHRLHRAGARLFLDPQVDRAPSNSLLDRWQAQSVNGDLARIRSRGDFDKAEIARAPEYESQQPLVSDAHFAGVSMIDNKRQDGRSSLAIATPLAFLCVIVR